MQRSLSHWPLHLLLLHLLLLSLSSSLLLSSTSRGCLVAAAAEVDGGLEPGSRHAPPSFDRQVEEAQRGGGGGGGGGGERGGGAEVEGPYTAGAEMGGVDEAELGKVERVSPSSSSSPSSSPSHAALLSPPLSACTAKAHPGVVRFVREAAPFYPTVDVHWTGTVPRLQLFSSAAHRRDNIVDPAHETEQQLMDRLTHPHSTLTYTHTDTLLPLCCVSPVCVCADCCAVLHCGGVGEYQRPLSAPLAPPSLLPPPLLSSDSPHRSVALCVAPSPSPPPSVSLSVSALLPPLPLLSIPSFPSFCSSARRVGAERAELR